MAARTFGAYTPHDAKTVKDQGDRDLCRIEDRLRHIAGLVPNASLISDHADQILEDARELVADQQKPVDERTDSSEGAT
jgi:hypothetical protein